MIDDSFDTIKSNLKIGKLQSVKISFVIPTYKRPKGLRRAISSIISQDTDVAYNIIVVDNSDREEDYIDTEALINELNRFNNIVYYRNERNMGCFPNWHRAFELGNGEYLVMLHADDYMLPGSINEIYNVFESNPKVDAMFCERYSHGIDANIYNSQEIPKSTIKRRLRGFIKDTICTKKQIHHVRPIDFVFGFCYCATTVFAVKRSLILRGLNIPNWKVTESADTYYALQLCQNSNLFFFDKPMGVKTEEPDNQGHRKDITIPVVIIIKKQFNIFKHNNLYTRFLVNMRVFNIASGFGISEEPAIKAILPEYVYKKWSRTIWYYIGIVYKIKFKRR